MSFLWLTYALNPPASVLHTHTYTLTRNLSLDTLKEHIANYSVLWKKKVLQYFRADNNIYIYICLEIIEILSWLYGFLEI